MKKIKRTIKAKFDRQEKGTSMSVKIEGVNAVEIGQLVMALAGELGRVEGREPAQILIGLAFKSEIGETNG